MALLKDAVAAAKRGVTRGPRRDIRPGSFVYIYIYVYIYILLMININPASPIIRYIP